MSDPNKQWLRQWLVQWFSHKSEKFISQYSTIFSHMGDLFPWKTTSFEDRPQFAWTRSSKTKNNSAKLQKKIVFLSDFAKFYLDYQNKMCFIESQGSLFSSLICVTTYLVCYYNLKKGEHLSPPCPTHLQRFLPIYIYKLVL